MDNKYEEFDSIGLGLERFHGLFYQLWAMGSPRFTDKIPTAAIAFNKQGQFVEFLFNEKFWDSLVPYEKEFVIAHEISHCLLEHGKRAKNCDQQQIANIAMDIVVNHGLVDNFKFDRTRLPTIDNIIIWKEKVFGKKSSAIEDRREFEYYYDKIMKECPLVKIPTLDVHGFSKGEKLPDGSIPIPDHILGEMIDKAEDALAEEEFNKAQQVGIISGTEKRKVKRQEKRILQRWEKVIHRWTCKDDLEDDVWTREPRRMQCMSREFFLPWDGPDEKIGGKTNVWFFQDTSGSCTEFADHFFNAARTFPENFFNIKAFCFDTMIYPIDYKNPTLKGFGGTAFDIIEDYISKSKLAYPDAVFIFTDGCGNAVTPKFPDRWYWFLEGNYQNKSFIHKDSKVYQLKDFIA